MASDLAQPYLDLGQVGTNELSDFDDVVVVAVEIDARCAVPDVSQQVGFLRVSSLGIFPDCADIAVGHSPEEAHPVAVRLVQEFQTLGVDVSCTAMIVAHCKNSCGL